MSSVKTYMRKEWLYRDHEEESYLLVMSAETKTQPRCKSFEATFKLSTAQAV